MKKLFVMLNLALVASLLLSACATPAPTASVTAVPTALITVPTGVVSQKGKLLICTDFPYPPQEFFDENGEPQGVDVEIGKELGKRMGLEVYFINSMFDTIIAAVNSKKCDIILSALSITAERNIQVSMIPYFQAGQSMVAAKGNPQNINSVADLCGKSAAAESGTIEADLLNGEASYKGKGLSEQCVKDGKQPITVVITQKDSDALQQLQAGKVVVYFADSPVAAHYTVEHPDQFQLVGQIIDPSPQSIGLPCDAKDCTNAPLTPLGETVKAALKSMMDDGTYTKILTKWNLMDSAVMLP